MGRTDIELNEKGRKQAQELAEKINNLKIDICYASPLKRAKETAEIICADQSKNIGIIPDERLLERDCGIASGQIVTDWAIYESDQTAESEESMMARAKSFLETIKKSSQEHILVVSHSGPIKHLRHLLVTPDEDFSYTKWQIGNCELCEIVVSD